MITQTLVSDVVLFPEADREYALVSLYLSVCLSVHLFRLGQILETGVSYQGSKHGSSELMTPSSPPYMQTSDSS